VSLINEDLPVRRLLRKPHPNATFQETIKLLSNEDYVVGARVGGNCHYIEYSCYRPTTGQWMLLLRGFSESIGDNANAHFLQIAEKMLNVVHPNVHYALEFAQDTQGQLFLITESIDFSWRDVFYKLDRDTNLAVLRIVAKAMSWVHANVKLIHRNLRPEIIGFARGTPLVRQWQGATQIAEATTASLYGSPSYMPPEVACHKRELFGVTLDVYILGAILFEILVGQPPHPGISVMEAVQAAANNVIIETDSRDALLPVAKKAMSTEPKDRYQTVDEMLSAIDTIEDELTIARPFSIPPHREPVSREIWWAGVRNEL